MWPLLKEFVSGLNAPAVAQIENNVNPKDIEMNEAETLKLQVQELSKAVGYLVAALQAAETAPLSDKAHVFIEVATNGFKGE